MRSHATAAKMSLHEIGPLLQGVGALLGGLAAASAGTWGFLKRHAIASFFRDRSVLIAERDAAMRESVVAERTAVLERARAEAAEGSAASWESTARSVRTDVDNLLPRLASLELYRSKQEVKFIALVGFCVKVMDYGAFLEEQLSQHGISIDRKMPPAPAELLDDLRLYEALHNGD